MARKALLKEEKIALRRASPQQMPVVLGTIRRYLRDGSWLGTTNRYEGAKIGRLRKDVKDKNVRQRHLGQFTAAAAMRHTLDGWSYLGTSIQAISRGDTDHGLHLAYYASLRAAEAVLGTQGVAILDRQHFVVEEPSKVSRIGKEDIGTHQIVWWALDHWAGLRRSEDALADAIRPGSINLSTWLLAGFGGYPWRRVARRWLASWGTDLREMADDRDRRNRASYQPGGRGVASPPASETAEFVRDVWRALEPSAVSPFDRLDRHLLRISFDEVFLETEIPPRTRRKREAAVDRLLAGMTYLPVGTDWRRFLLRLDDPSDLTILGHASNAGKARDAEHLSVAARSLLLLRLASGMTASLRLESGVSERELEFWWVPVLRNRGLWDDPADAPDPSDLWTDVEAALVDLQTWLTAGPGGSFRSLNDTQSRALHDLAGTERAGVWGLRL